MKMAYPQASQTNEQIQGNALKPMNTAYPTAASVPSERTARQLEQQPGYSSRPIQGQPAGAFAQQQTQGAAPSGDAGYSSAQQAAQAITRFGVSNLGQHVQQCVQQLSQIMDELKQTQSQVSVQAEAQIRQLQQVQQKVQQAQMQIQQIQAAAGSSGSFL